MFEKLLVANRGEIALRIIRACKELGIKTVAVFSEQDRDSLHVRFADEAICIGPASPAQSYLNIPGIVSAAEISNSDAIHPGYGFLAENAHFAEVCNSCGIKFIGPSPEVINKMGDKAIARDTMKKAKVPIVPGSEGILDNWKQANEIASEFGFPVILKASGGGGGKGMRIVREPSEMESAFSIAIHESEANFGRNDIYLEKFLENPRHIEFQILGDQHGNVVHFGERECSIQRRYQKLVEESPSPAVDKDLRKRMGEDAVKAAKEVGYFSAGTIEFLLNDDMQYYFMEMNTRIQVEHPVTEMVIMEDLVKEQIKIAANEKLPFTESLLEPIHNAIECRINAEDPDYNFSPSPGLITAFHTPGGPGVRVDTHVYAQCEVSPYYDSLLAKLITYGNKREEALDRMERALEEFVIEGIKTTIPFHLKVIKNKKFRSGNYDTTFIQKEIIDGSPK